MGISSFNWNFFLQFPFYLVIDTVTRPTFGKPFLMIALVNQI